VTKANGISINFASRLTSFKSPKAAKEEDGTSEEATLSYNLVQKSWAHVNLGAKEEAGSIYMKENKGRPLVLLAILAAERRRANSLRRR
jgi:hypothetical protein